MHNFHVPLSEELYGKLRAHADKAKCPAAELARSAIESFLERLERRTLFDDISDYAKANAGGSTDLDKELENSAIESLLGEEKE